MNNKITLLHKKQLGEFYDKIIAAGLVFQTYLKSAEYDDILNNDPTRIIGYRCCGKTKWIYSATLETEHSARKMSMKLGDIEDFDARLVNFIAKMNATVSRRENMKLVRIAQKKEIEKEIEKQKNGKK